MGSGRLCFVVMFEGIQKLLVYFHFRLTSHCPEGKQAYWNEEWKRCKVVEREREVWSILNLLCADDELLLAKSERGNREKGFGVSNGLISGIYRERPKEEMRVCDRMSDCFGKDGFLNG